MKQTFSNSGDMGCARSLRVLILLVVATRLIKCASRTGRTVSKSFADDIDFNDPETGEVLKVKSKGSMKDFVNLNDVIGLQRIICKSNKILLAMDDSSAAEAWLVGDVIMGDDRWECKLGVPNSPQNGIFRKISSIRIIHDRKVEIISSEASFMDIFEYADIFYHHTPATKTEPTTPPSGDRARNTTARDRGRRSATQYLDANWRWDAPKFNVNFNFDEATQLNSQGAFKVIVSEDEKVQFSHEGNTFFANKDNKVTDTEATIEDTKQAIQFDCTDCYFYFKFAVTLKLKIELQADKTLKLTEYYLQIDATEFTLNTIFGLSAKKDMSSNMVKKFWEFQPSLPVKFPILSTPISGLFLEVNPTLALSYESAIDVKKGLGIHSGFQFVGSFTITQSKTGDAALKTETSVTATRFHKYAPVIDSSAEVEGSLSVFPTVSITPKISFDPPPGGQFTFDLTAPLNATLKPPLGILFEEEASMVAAIYGPTELDVNLEFSYAVDPVSAVLSIVSHPTKFEFSKEPATGSKTLFSDPKVLHTWTDLVCLSTFSTIDCGDPGPAVENATEPLVEYEAGDNVVIAAGVTPMMLTSLKDKLDEFIELIMQHPSMENRKVIIKSAWEAPTEATGEEEEDAESEDDEYIIAGQVVTIGITEESSEEQTKDGVFLDDIVKYLECAGFCNVSKSNYPDDNDISLTVIPDLSGTVDEQMKVFTLIPPTRTGTVRVYEMPVGDGDFTVIQCDDGTLTFVGIGAQSDSYDNHFLTTIGIRKFLGSENINTNVKHVFITHPSVGDSHVNMAAQLLSSAADPTEITIYYSKAGGADLADEFDEESPREEIANCNKDTACKTLDEICSGVTMKVLGSGLGTGNDDKGLVLKLVFGGFSVLFPGPVSSEAAINLLDEGELKSTVYKLSKNSRKDSKANAVDFINKVAPEVILAYGDPWNDGAQTPCEVLEAAMKVSTLSSAQTTYQRTFTCTIASGTVYKKKKLDKKVAFYTSAPTEDSVCVASVTHESHTASTATYCHGIAVEDHGFHSLKRRKRDADDEFTPFARGGDFPDLSWCDSDKFPELLVGETAPKDTPEDVDECLPIVAKVTRSDRRFEYLFEYAMDDVAFANEEKEESTWCGTSGRECPDCAVDEGGEKRTGCQDRIMTLRIAFRLRRLAYFVAQEHLGDDAEESTKKVKVLDAWDESTSKYPKGKHPKTSLHHEGRALTLTLIGGSGDDVAKLAQLAQCAGFDWVKRVSNTKLQVCVLPQNGIMSELVVAPSGHRIHVASIPASMDGEYGYPEEMENVEIIKPKLFDGYNKSIPLTANFTIGHYAHPGFRFWRYDEMLVQCVQQAFDLFPEFNISYGNAYRPTSQNRFGLSTRHVEEKFRYRTGQAVDLVLLKWSKKTLYDLAERVAQACVPIVIYKQMAIGIGAHPSNLYFDVRSKTSDRKKMKVWKVGKSVGWFEKLGSLAKQINEGGPIIQPYKEEIACATPEHGEDLYFITLKNDKDKSCTDDDASFCSDTKKYRVTAEKNLEKKLKGLLRGKMIPTSDIKNCFVENCGCGLGKGPKWNLKVVNCLKFLKNFVDASRIPFRLMAKARIYNTDRVNSSLHAIACKTKGYTCAENTQIRSLVDTALLKRYKPNPQESIEELLYGSRDNALPVIEIIGQFFALHAKGEVSVYIEDKRDLSALHNQLKILLAYNTQVTRVTFHLKPSVNKGRFQDGLNRKLEGWASSVCPKYSRAAIAPILIEVLSHKKVKRSIEDSADRNLRMQQIRGFEHAWLMKT